VQTFGVYPASHEAIAAYDVGYILLRGPDDSKTNAPAATYLDAGNGGCFRTAVCFPPALARAAKHASDKKVVGSALVPLQGAEAVEARRQQLRRRFATGVGRLPDHHRRFLIDAGLEQA
jgi:hypothetical protein